MFIYLEGKGLCIDLSENEYEFTYVKRVLMTVFFIFLFDEVLFFFPEKTPPLPLAK